MKLIVAMTLLAGAASAEAPFTLTSPDIAPGAVISDEQVFNGFGCSGKNVSPALSWTGAPKGTESFAVLVHDPDAPTGGAGWWHWLLINVPGAATGLDKGAGAADGSKLPKGASQVATDFGGPGWGGPCPPEGHGVHHYNFTVYALKVKALEVPKGATASLVGYLVNANSLGKATLTGTYSRGK